MLTQEFSRATNSGVRRWFWTCGNQGDQCTHFKWADDTRPDPPPSASGGQARASGGQGRGSAAGGSPAGGGSASRAPKRVHFTLREEEDRFGVEFPFDDGLVAVMREHKVDYNGLWDADGKTWHFMQEGYEAVLASVRAFCDEHNGWQVCPVPAFVTAMLASEHARRDPRPLAIATLASRLPARAGARHCLATDLQPHQREGVIALLRRGGCGLLADEMVRSFFSYSSLHFNKAEACICDRAWARRCRRLPRRCAFRTTGRCWSCVPRAC